jgi:hypothetical protein
MSMSTKSMIAATLVCCALAGCVTNEAIIAGAVDTVGISASGGTTDQGGNLVVGFKGAKFAVVPVQNERGNLVYLRDGPGKERGFSVLAMLGVDAAAGANIGAGIHQVVAVGRPADYWALGQATKKVTVSGTPVGGTP